MASSGDLIADRRYGYAQAALDDGDAAGAADLARQTLDLAPGFAAAWFLLGRACESAADGRDEAVGAFRQAAALDPADALGAGLHLALLGAADPETAMSAGYVTALFDEYAIRFDRHLTQSLAYRAPALLHDAVRRACSLTLRDFAFAAALDLGCGTGLAGDVFRPQCRRLAGIDLSPAMLRRAAAKRLYDELATGDLAGWLAVQAEASADLVLAADVFVYLADLTPVFASVARVLGPGGLFAFTVQSDGSEGEAPRLGPDQRYWHGVGHLESLSSGAGLRTLVSETVSTRQDRGIDVPGRLFVLAR